MILKKFFLKVFHLIVIDFSIYALFSFFLDLILPK